MTGVVFFETLRRYWRQMLYWGLAIGSLMALNVVAIPNMDALKEMGRLLETLPPIMLQMFGATDIEYMATPEGYLASQTFMLLLLIMGVYAIVVGLNVTANDEERGIMDNVLALPIPRWRLVLEKLLAYALMTAGLLALIFLATWGSLLITPAFQVDTGKLVLATLNGLPGALVVLAFTTLVAAVVRRKSMAMGIAAVFLVGSYLIDNLGAAASESFLALIRPLSFHAYYDGMNVMRNGLNVGNMTLLLVVAVVLAALAMFAYQRRDVGV
ncbi:MAG: ABC transporter permease subunit [Anaerolineae bacterium]|nr:ABC transporter permease subunit [Anaerolineae bacterium]